MSRGTPHPENLKPIQTPEEAKEKGRRGGIASGKARKRRALYREILQDIMAQPIKVPFQDGLLCADGAGAQSGRGRGYGGRGLVP